MKKMAIKVAVLATDANGEPAWFYTRVSVTSAEYTDGEHYQLARDEATKVGFEAPMVAMDAMDSAAQGMRDISAWFKE